MRILATPPIQTNRTYQTRQNTNGIYRQPQKDSVSFGMTIGPKLKELLKSERAGTNADLMSRLREIMSDTCDYTLEFLNNHSLRYSHELTIRDNKKISLAKDFDVASELFDFLSVKNIKDFVAEKTRWETEVTKTKEVSDAALEQLFAGK